MSTPEDLFGDALRARVDHTEQPRTPLTEVVSTAHRIRRRRRIGTAAVSAVVLAVLATPFVLTAGDGPDSAPAPAEPAPSVPPADVRLADVALGAPPSLAWLDGSDYVAADGTRTTLPFDAVTRATPYAGGFLVTAFDDNQVTLLDSQLREVSQRCYAGSGFAVSDDGLRTAYPTSRCDRSEPTLHVGATSGDGDEWTAPMPLADAGPVGFLGDRVVVSSFNQGPPAVVGPDGSVTTLDALGIATDVDEPRGLVAGRLAGDPSSEQVVPTGAVLDASTGTARWSMPGWSLQSFSPDGSLVLGARADAGGTSWAVFDSETGEQRHEFATPAGFGAFRVAWEDDEHLLMVIVQDRTEAIVRTTLDGAIERASDTAPYDEDGGQDRRFGIAPHDFP